MYVSHCIVQIVRRDYKRGAESLVSVGSRTKNDEIEVERCEAPLCSYIISRVGRGESCPLCHDPFMKLSINGALSMVQDVRSRTVARERESEDCSSLQGAGGAEERLELALTIE